MEKKRWNRIIQQLLERSGLQIQVQLQPYFGEGRLVGGKYGMGTRTVTMYTEAVKEQCIQLFGSLERVDEYFTIVLAHELGHAADPLLAILYDELESSLGEQTKSRIALQIEENAWNYAMALIPEIESSMIHAIIDESLHDYRLKAGQLAAVPLTA